MSKIGPLPKNTGKGEWLGALKRRQLDGRFLSDEHVSGQQATLYCLVWRRIHGRWHENHFLTAFGFRPGAAELLGVVDRKTIRLNASGDFSPT
jgi:hypothetical protein